MLISGSCPWESMKRGGCKFGGSKIGAVLCPERRGCSFAVVTQAQRVSAPPPPWDFSMFRPPTTPPCTATPVLGPVVRDSKWRPVSVSVQADRCMATARGTWLGSPHRLTQGLWTIGLCKPRGKDAPGYGVSIF